MLATLMTTSFVANAAVSFSDYDNEYAELPDISQISESGKLEASALLNGLVPHGWQVNIDPALNGTMLSYKSTFGWKNAIRLIEKLNTKLHVSINNEQRVVAVALSEFRLQKLDIRDPLVWELDPTKTLSENFNIWSRRSNIKIIYDAKMDYPVLAKSILFGKLEGQGQVIDKILKSTYKKYPLSNDYLPNIPAIVIVDGGAIKKEGTSK